MLLGLSAAMLALAANANGGSMAAWLARALVRTRYDGAQTWRQAGEAVILSMAPAALAGIAGYVAGTLAQTGFLLHPAAIQPDLSRISPLAGIKRLVGPHMLAQTLKSIAKLAVLGGCFWLAMRHVLPGLIAAPYIEPGALYRRILVMSAQLALLLLGGHAVIAGADVAWERYHHAPPGGEGRAQGHRGQSQGKAASAAPGAGQGAAADAEGGAAGGGGDHQPHPLCGGAGL